MTELIPLLLQKTKMGASVTPESMLPIIDKRLVTYRPINPEAPSMAKRIPKSGLPFVAFWLITLSTLREVHQPLSHLEDDRR